MTNQLIVVPANEIYERFSSLSRAIKRIEDSLELSPSERIPGDKLLNKAEVAEMLGCSVSTVDNMRRKGSLTRINVGKSARFRLSEINAIVNQEIKRQ